MDDLFSKIQNSLSDTNTDSKTNSKSNDKSVLLNDQQSTQNKINDLLEKSYNSLMCGPSCQKQKKTDELKQKYLDAQTNLTTAPTQLVQAKKNYYVYAEGENKYNAMQEEELKAVSKKMGEELASLFNDELKNANTMSSYLHIATTNSQYTIDLLTNYLKENKKMMEQLRESRSDIVTNDRKTYYENEATNNLELWYTLFWYVFYLLYIILVAALILTQQFAGVVASIVLLFYPYYINWLSTKLVTNWKTTMNRFPSNVYNNL